MMHDSECMIHPMLLCMPMVVCIACPHRVVCRFGLQQTMDRGQVLTALRVCGLQERAVSPEEEQVGHSGSMKLVPGELRRALPDKQMTGSALIPQQVSRPVAGDTTQDLYSVKNVRFC